MQISIIIPVYNEAKNIGRLVNYLVTHKTDAVAEIIVVDAASTDNTALMAERAGAKSVISPQKGRGAQLHYGATIANGEILYFIHADTFPPPSYADDILNAVNDGFDLGRYISKYDSSKWYLKINEWFTRMDLFICLGGDQTLFITSGLYKKSGGFNAEMHIMEEFEFVVRARKMGNYKIFKKPAIISARKYDNNGWWQVLMANRKVVKMYHNGAAQADMIKTYKQMLRP